MSADKEMEARVATLEREMGEVRKALFTGNGQPPVISQLSSLTQWSKSQTWVTRATLGGVVANFIQQLFG